jgi:hypothetical protein
MKTRKSRSPRLRGLTATNPQATTPIKVESASAAGSVVTVEFDQVIALNGTPKYTTDVAGADATSAVQTSPTTIAITFDASVAAATELTIPYEEPAVRNASGGFVSTSTFPV